MAVHILSSEQLSVTRNLACLLYTSGIKQKYFGMSIELMYEQLESQRPFVKELIRLSLEFYDAMEACLLYTSLAKNLVSTGKEIENNYCIPIVNKRISVTPIALVEMCIRDRICTDLRAKR